MDASHQRLERQIEELVRAHLEGCRRAAAAAVDRAFTTVTKRTTTVMRPARQAPQGRRSPRSEEELARLEEQFYDAVCAMPGESMMVLAARVGIPSRRLAVPVRRLRRAGKVRMVGEQNGARYFPMAEQRTSKAKLAVVESRS